MHETLDTRKLSNVPRNESVLEHGGNLVTGIIRWPQVTKPP